MAIFGGIFDYDGKKDRLEEVIGLSEDPDLWNDPKKAEAIGKERKMLEDVVLTVEEVSNGIDDNRMLLEMAAEEDDEHAFSAVQDDILALEKRIADLEFKRMFDQPADANNCFIDITAGAGGTEAEDWAACCFVCIAVTLNARVLKSTFWKRTRAKLWALTVPQLS